MYLAASFQIRSGPQGDGTVVAARLNQFLLYNPTVTPVALVPHWKEGIKGSRINFVTLLYQLGGAYTRWWVQEFAANNITPEDQVTAYLAANPTSVPMLVQEMGNRDSNPQWRRLLLITASTSYVSQGAGAAALNGAPAAPVAIGDYGMMYDPDDVDRPAVAALNLGNAPWPIGATAPLIHQVLNNQDLNALSGIAPCCWSGVVETPVQPDVILVGGCFDPNIVATTDTTTSTTSTTTTATFTSTTSTSSSSTTTDTTTSTTSTSSTSTSTSSSTTSTSSTSTSSTTSDTTTSTTSTSTTSTSSTSTSSTSTSTSTSTSSTSTGSTTTTSSTSTSTTTSSTTTTESTTTTTTIPGDCDVWSFNAQWNCDTDDWDIIPMGMIAEGIPCQPNEGWTILVDECLLHNAVFVATGSPEPSPSAPGSSPSSCCPVDPCTEGPDTLTYTTEVSAGTGCDSGCSMIAIYKKTASTATTVTYSQIYAATTNTSDPQCFLCGPDGVSFDDPTNTSVDAVWDCEVGAWTTGGFGYIADDCGYALDKFTFSYNLTEGVCGYPFDENQTISLG